MAPPKIPQKIDLVLDWLRAPPRLQLRGVQKLKISLAYRNDHFGARHFVKEQLPRIRFANPNLDIQSEAWRPEIELVFEDGKQKTLDLHEKWSTTIVKELMDTAGTEGWTRWKTNALASGLPIVPGEENEAKARVSMDVTRLPSLKEFRAAKQRVEAANPKANPPRTTTKPSAAIEASPDS
ncbi:uncharacterized protein EV420DRAFT_1520602 [Desarmillaria tabescens]|uniref:Ribosomal protein/NADH dehydrogenase domain-containing protein n=1 Tax=Armillaria tabescens TaxID=1929756 RepID=A0AA39NE04_ARMTA|nr:uncharacterized protein EV420DRAFT_1520602 [Desarmillaria tabescens]KAK0463892.1 hypothetical protein EV420DRAFT_1520602 [Desarmillaria tabescens]